MEKQEFWFINNIAHPLPDLPRSAGEGIQMANTP